MGRYKTAEERQNKRMKKNKARLDAQLAAIKKAADKESNKQEVEDGRSKTGT